MSDVDAGVAGAAEHTGHSNAPRVAFQGELGAFSEEAALGFFPGQAAAPVPVPAFDDVASAVLTGAADYGVLPVENATHGSVSAACDVLAARDIAAIGELVQPIRLFLLGTPGATLSGVRRVLSHAVALGQCGRFLATLADAAAEAVYDTAGAAQRVAAAADPALAAIASHGAARRYGLDVLAADVQDRADNATRFLLVARRTALRWPEPEQPGPWKVVLVLEVEHRAGTLAHLLGAFADHGINLTRIESRPAAALWSYRFFVELVCDDVHALDAAMAAARERASRIDVIGCFRPPPGAAVGAAVRP